MIDTKALFNINYGLYVLTARENGRDNGCIVNTVEQVADSPLRLSVAVSKRNLTHDMILRTARFNVSLLTEEAPFSLFQHFGFQSGRDLDKFQDWPETRRSENGLLYLTNYTNSFFSGVVRHAIDMESHTLFLAEVGEANVLSKAPSVSYNYYQQHIKPAPAAKKGWRCKICGYVYEGDVLPEGYICPLCKHGVEAFEKVTDNQATPPQPKENKPLHSSIKTTNMEKYICNVCGYEYDPANGDPDNGIAPGTPFEALPEDWKCPLCGVDKSHFEKL